MRHTVGPPRFPVCQALERDEEAVAMLKAEVWPQIKMRDQGVYVFFEDKASQGVSGPGLSPTGRGRLS
jgi:hypothetical protein